MPKYSQLRDTENLKNPKYAVSLSIRNKINVLFRLVIFPLYFPKFSLNNTAIRVKFGSSKEKIMPRRKNIYLISDT